MGPGNLLQALQLLCGACRGSTFALFGSQFPCLNPQQLDTELVLSFSDLWRSSGLTSLDSVILTVWDHSRDSGDSWGWRW